MCTETLLLYNFVSKAVEKAPVRFNKGPNSRETPRGFSPQIQKNQNLKNLARRSSSVDNSGQEVIESRDPPKHASLACMGPRNIYRNPASIQLRGLRPWKSGLCDAIRTQTLGKRSPG